MRLWIPFMLAVTTTIGLGYDSTAAAQQLPDGVSIVVRLNDDVVCADCPPGSQPEEWEMIVTNQLSEACTRVDTYHAACPQGCQWTLVNREYSGSCSGLESATIGLCPECPGVEDHEV